mmetsp:Transcript_15163/g.25987  ORF Transcript_15163/g.25987 Transcript_15163/m.25987 type:complete len:94 (+) Transcript_15163:1526-1807(+)
MTTPRKRTECPPYQHGIKFSSNAVHVLNLKNRKEKLSLCPNQKKYLPTPSIPMKKNISAVRHLHIFSPSRRLATRINYLVFSEISSNALVEKN